MEDLRLVLVQVAVRHGDRSPVTSLSEDDEHFWSPHMPSPSLLAAAAASSPLQGELQQLSWSGTGVMGQLTQRGFEQLEQFGKTLREELCGSLIPSDWHPELPLIVRSTPFSRTAVSAQALLAGLYPGRNAESPIAVAVEDGGVMVPDSGSCNDPQSVARHQEITQEEWDDCDQFEDAHGLDEQRVKLAATIGLDCGEEARGSQWIRLKELLTCWDAYDNLPEGVTKTDVKFASQQLARRMSALYSSPEMCRLSLGRFVFHLMENIRDAAVKDPTVKLRLFSVHDSTLLCLMSAFGVAHHVQGEWPPYGSALRMDVFQRPDAEHVVRITLNGKPLSPDGVTDFWTMRELLAIERGFGDAN